MKRKSQFIAIGLVIVLAATLSVTRGSAQHSHDHNSNTSWKTGMLRISNPVRAGNVQLKSGMYHVKHVTEGVKHFIIFKSVALAAGYRESSMFEEKEVAKVECRVEPAENSVSNTKIGYGKTAAGGKSIQSLQIAGEKVKHILLAS